MALQMISNWGTWQQMRNTLVQTLSMNMQARNDQPPGSPAAVAYTRNIEQNLDDLQVHAISGLRKIDDAIAESNIATDLNKASAQLKREADRIRNAIRTIEGLSKLTGSLTKLVLGIRGL